MLLEFDIFRNRLMSLVSGTGKSVGQNSISVIIEFSILTRHNFLDIKDRLKNRVPDNSDRGQLGPRQVGP